MFSLFGTKELIAASIGLIVVVYVGILKVEITTLKTDNKALNAQVISFEAVALSAIQGAKSKAEQTVKEIEVIRYKDKEKIKIVKEYIYDKDKTACENALSRLRLTDF